MIKPKAFLFDLDGTIVDTVEYHKTTWASIIQKLDLNVLDYDLDSLIHYPSKEIFRMILHENYEYTNIEKFLLENDSMFLDITRGKDLLAVGFIEYIQYIKKAGKLTGLISSSSTNVIYTILHRTKISDFFDLVISGEDVRYGKPNPECYILGLKRLNISYKNAIAFEDSLHGIKSARGASIITIRVDLNNNQIETEQSECIFTINEYRDDKIYNLL